MVGPRSRRADCQHRAKHEERILQRIVNVVYRVEPPIMVRMELDPVTFDYFS